MKNPFETPDEESVDVDLSDLESPPKSGPTEFTLEELAERERATAEALRREREREEERERERDAEYRSIAGRLVADSPLLKARLEDPDVAARFHAALTDWIRDTCIELHTEPEQLRRHPKFGTKLLTFSMKFEDDEKLLKLRKRAA